AVPGWGADARDLRGGAFGTSVRWWRRRGRSYGTNTPERDNPGTTWGVGHGPGNGRWTSEDGRRAGDPGPRSRTEKPRIVGQQARLTRDGGAHRSFRTRPSTGQSGGDCMSGPEGRSASGRPLGPGPLRPGPAHDALPIQLVADHPGVGNELAVAGDRA